MTNPFTIPIATDAATQRQANYDAAKAINPDWVELDGEPDKAMFDTSAEVRAEILGNLSTRLRSEVLTWVGDLMGVPRGIGSAATSTITVTPIDSLEHTLDSGTILWLGDIQLRTTAAGVFPAGAGTGVVIPLEAVEFGAAVNGSTGTLDLPVAAWIDTHELDDPLEDGADPEDDATYARQLRDNGQLRSIAVLKARDAVLVALSHPLVGWAYGLDHYNGATDLEQDRHVTVVITKADGTAVAGGTKAEVLAALQVLVGTNFTIHVVDPILVPIPIVCTVTPYAGFEALAPDNADEALTTRVSPAPWLTPPYSLVPNFAPSRRVHKSDLIAAADAALGVDIVDTLVIDGDPDLDEVVLESPRHLPTPGTITVTIATP